PFALIQKCLADDELQAVGRVVLYGREELVLVRPVNHVLAMTALKFGSEVAHAEALDEEVEKADMSAGELKLTHQLLGAFEKPKFSLAEYKDQYVEELTKLIEAKVQGKELVTPPAPEEPKVINLMDALKKSVAAAKKGGNGHVPTGKSRKTAAHHHNGHRSTSKRRRKSA